MWTHFFFASWIPKASAPPDGVAIWEIDENEDATDSFTALCGVPTWKAEAFT